MTWPAGTVGSLAVVTVPTVRLAAKIAPSAAGQTQDIEAVTRLGIDAER
jgi:hypothetical protein